MKLYANPTITDFRQDVNGDIKMLKIGVDKEDAYANIIAQAEGGDLEDNKTATINVSTYTQPVEITPTAGKDGMKKATITLSNIPSPSGATTLYAWRRSLGGGNYGYVYSPSTTVEVGDHLFIGNTGLDDGTITITENTITEVGEGTFVIESHTYSRYADGDISLT